MTAKLTKLTDKIAIQLHVVAQSYTISGSRSKRPVRKLLDTSSYFKERTWITSVSRESALENIWA